MKRRSMVMRWGLVILCLVISASFFTTVSVEAADKVHKWRCQAFEPASEMPVSERAFRSLEKASGGRIKIDLFSGGALVPSPDILKAVGSGMITMGIGYGGYWPSRIDVGNIETGLPMTWRNAGDAFDVLWSRDLIGLIREAYREQGVYWWPKFGSLYCLISTKPVTSLNDMKGMKIRVAGPTSKLLKSVGVATTYLPFEEVYMALATGTIDGAIMGPLDTYHKMKMYEVAKYYMDFSFMMPTCVNTFINLKVWEGLPDDLKEIVDLAMFKNSFETHKSHIAAEYKLRRELAGKGTITITKLDDASIKELQKSAIAVWDEEAKKSPRAAKAIEIIKGMLQDKGYLD